MDMGTEAATAATNTLTSYIENIRALEDEAAFAAGKVANAVAKALGNATPEYVIPFAINTPEHGIPMPQWVDEYNPLMLEGGTGYTGHFNLPTFDGYANGTSNASAGLAMVGEEGPELMRFGGGEIVHTAPETRRILADFNSQYGAKEESNYRTPEEKKITLEISGSGSIFVDSKMSKQSILEILQDNLTPVLMKIVTQDIFEEGKGSYNY